MKYLKYLIFAIVFFTIVIAVDLYYIHYKTNTSSITTKESHMVISSSAFEDNAVMPDKYTCNGAGINPSLFWDKMPDDTKSIAIIVDDPDAPSGDFTHWLLWNIDPTATEIAENSTPTGSMVGTNDGGTLAYYPPCPPNGTHHYQFKVYALDEALDAPRGSKKAELESAMHPHIIDYGMITGLYSAK